MNMLPLNNVSKRDTMTDNGNHQMFPTTSNHVYDRRNLPGKQQLVNTQSTNSKIPSRVGSAPIGTSIGLGFQNFGANQPQMAGMLSSIINPNDGSLYSSGLFPQRPKPEKALTPGAMPINHSLFGADRSNEGMFQQQGPQYGGQMPDLYFDRTDLNDQIDEVNSNSLDSANGPEDNLAPHYTVSRPNYTPNIKNGIRELIKNDEFQTETMSKGDQSGQESENYQQPKQKVVQPSFYVRNPQTSALPIAQGYQGMMYPGKGLHEIAYSYRHDTYHDRNYDNEQSYEDHQDYPTYGYQEESYTEHDGDTKFSKNGRNQKIPKESDYLASQKSKTKPKPKEKKKSAKPSHPPQHLVETYEPIGLRYPTQGGMKGKQSSYHSKVNIKEWNKQQGSRNIQHFLETEPKEVVSQMIRELIPDLLDISLNIFGNYVAQKMIEVGKCQ